MIQIPYPEVRYSSVLLRFTLGVLLAIGGAGSCAAQPPREYSFDTAADAEILTATYRGGMLAYVATYHLFGDGTLRIALSDPQRDAVPWEEHSTRLAPDELQAILSSAVDAGLMEFDFASRREALRRRGRTTPVVADAPDFLVQFSVANYRGPGNPMGGPMKHSLVMHAPFAVAKALPDVPEFQAVAGLEHALTALFVRARAESQGKGR